jgi:hypothetical protein
MSRQIYRALLGSLAVCAFSLVASQSLAAPRWVARSITLPRHDWAFDFGLGVGHFDAPDPPTGVGLNVEIAVGVTRHLELGVREGFRFGAEGRATRADEYGRLFDRQTFGTNHDDLANPEFRMRGALVDGPVVELALEGRAALPIENGSELALEFGMPVWFHLGRSVRLDTGVFVPIAFYEPTLFSVSAPLDVWIQCSPALWLGPMTGVRVTHQGSADRTDVSLGFGLGYSLGRTADLKTMALAPGINHERGARNFGVGIGLQLRIE